MWEVNSEIQSMRSLLERRIGERNKLLNLLKKAEEESVRLTKRNRHLEKALEVIQIVAKATQQSLEFHVSNLASLALDAIYDDPYKLNLVFELRRNRSEAVITLEDSNGNVVDPMDSVGGGVVDIAALSLRISLWSLKCPRPRATIIMDEPCRFVSRDLKERAFSMIKEISERMKIQFLIVTHEEEYISKADRVFKVSKRKGKSKVEKAI